MYAREDASFRACGIYHVTKKVMHGPLRTGLRVHVKLSRQRLLTNAKKTLVVSIMHAREDASFRACGIYHVTKKVTHGPQSSFKVVTATSTH